MSTVRVHRPHVHPLELPASGLDGLLIGLVYSVGLGYGYQFGATLFRQSCHEELKDQLGVHRATQVWLHMCRRLRIGLMCTCAGVCEYIVPLRALTQFTFK